MAMKILPTSMLYVLSLSVLAMTPLTEGELSQTTAQDGTALEENQLNQLLLIGALATVAEAAKDVVPVEADVLIEGIEYKEGGE